MPLNPALISFYDFMVAGRTGHFSDILLYRRYTDGIQTARLNADQIATFENDPDHVLNLCPTVLSAKVNRLRVTGIEITHTADQQATQDGESSDPSEDAPSQSLSEQLTEIGRQWWVTSGMDTSQRDIHWSASRDEDAYLIVDYEDQPRFSFNLTYDGDTGVDIIYEDDDPRRPVYATKRWNVVNPNNIDMTVKRLNVYYPNRIEKYINADGDGTFADANWLPYTGDGDPVINIVEGKNTYSAAVAWWTDELVEVVDSDSGEVLKDDEDNAIMRLGPDGTPLGIPVFHFANNAQGTAYGRSDLADIVPSLCDQANDASVDLRIASKFAGVNVNVILGHSELPATYAFTPGAFFAFPGENVKAHQFTASNLTQLIASKDSVLRDIATVSGTPLPMINPTAQVSAEGTLQQQETPLLERVESAQFAWGEQYENAMRMAISLEWVFGTNIDRLITQDGIAALSIATTWKPAAIRDAAKRVENAAMLHDKGIISQRAALEVIAPVYDWDGAKIDEILRDTRTDRQSSFADLTLGLPELGDSFPGTPNLADNGSGLDDLVGVTQ